MRKIIALLFTVILVIPLILAALVLINTNTSILDRNFYLHALNDDTVYVTILSDESIDGMISEQIPFLTSDGVPQIRVVIQSVITREFLNEQMSILINDLFDYLQGKTDSFKPVINFMPVKTALANEKSGDFLSAIVSALPICGPGVLPGIDTANLRACKPEGFSDDVLASTFLQPFLPLIITLIPDEIPVGNNWESLLAARNWGPFTSGRTLQAGILLATIFVGFVALSFWYIAALIADNSWRIRLQWLGWSFMVPSILVFLAGLATTSEISGYWINLGINSIPLNTLVHPSSLIDPMREIIRGVFIQMASTFMMAGGISGALGLGLIFWGLAVPKNS